MNHEERKKIILYIIIVLLFSYAIILTVLCGNSLIRINRLSKSVAALSSNDCQVHELQIDTYRKETMALKKLAAEKSQKEESIRKAVTDFLTSYYESDYSSLYTKLSWSSTYLSDDAIKELCPYINSPEEISDEIIKKIRAHDQSLVSGDVSNYKNTIQNLQLYNDSTSDNITTVFAYFILETNRKTNDNATKSPYLFSCNVVQDDGVYIINDILIKTPVILPAYDPETMIFN